VVEEADLETSAQAPLSLFEEDRLIVDEASWQAGYTNAPADERKFGIGY